MILMLRKFTSCNSTFISLSKFIIISHDIKHLLVHSIEISQRSMIQADISKYSRFTIYCVNTQFDILKHFKTISVFETINRTFNAVHHMMLVLLCAKFSCGLIIKSAKLCISISAECFIALFRQKDFSIFQKSATNGIKDKVMIWFQTKNFNSIRITLSKQMNHLIERIYCSICCCVTNLLKVFSDKNFLCWIKCNTSNVNIGFRSICSIGNRSTIPKQTNIIT